MPHPNDDADFAAARQALTDYETAAADARGNPRYAAYSELAIAEMVDTAYTNYTTAMQGAWERLESRRQARQDWLAAQVPTGPGVPDDATPADRAALTGAFRTHYERASGTDRDGRARMLDDADRFSDEPARRAVLTAILENSEIDTVRARPDRYGTLAGQLEELTELRRGGSITHRGFQRQAFRMMPQPKEVKRLPELKEEAEARRQKRLAERRNYW
jgi:hypothetical protein